MSLGRSSAGKVQWVTATGFSKQGTDCQEETLGKEALGIALPSSSTVLSCMTPRRRCLLGSLRSVTSDALLFTSTMFCSTTLPY